MENFQKKDVKKSKKRKTIYRRGPLWKSLKDLPTLTELFFGKGVDPATYKGENNTPAYLSGKGKKKTKSKTGTTKKKPIQEVKSATSNTKGKKAISKKLTAASPTKTIKKTKQTDKVDLPF